MGRGNRGRPAAWTPFPGLQTQGGTQTPHSFPVSDPPPSSRVGLSGAPFPPRLPSPYKHGAGEILSPAHPLPLLPASTLPDCASRWSPAPGHCLHPVPGSLCPALGPCILPGGGDRRAGGVSSVRDSWKAWARLALWDQDSWPECCQGLSPRGGGRWDQNPQVEIAEGKMRSMSSIAARSGAGWTEGRPALPAQRSTLSSPQRGSSWAKVRTLGAEAGWVAVSRQGKRGILHWVPDSLDLTGNFQINAPFSQRPPALFPMATLPLALPGRTA